MVSPMATYLKPLSQAYGLTAPLSGEPLLILANFMKKVPIYSLP